MILYNNLFIFQFFNIILFLTKITIILAILLLYSNYLILSYFDKLNYNLQIIYKLKL